MCANVCRMCYVRHRPRSYGAASVMRESTTKKKQQISWKTKKMCANVWQMTYVRHRRRSSGAAFLMQKSTTNKQICWKTKHVCVRMCDKCVMLDIGHRHLVRRLWCENQQQQKNSESVQKPSKCVGMCDRCVMLDIGRGHLGRRLCRKIEENKQICWNKK